MDVLTRYHRMLGDNADWLPGVDHAAIATEAVSSRELAKEGVAREDLGRERFVERAWEWSRTYGGADRRAVPPAGLRSGLAAVRASRWTRVCRRRCAASSCSSTARA